MRVGDILEVLAAVALVLAAYLYLGAPLALLGAGLALAYFGQCFSDAPVWRRKADRQ